MGESVSFEAEEEIDAGSPHTDQSTAEGDPSFLEELQDLVLSTSDMQE